MSHQNKSPQKQEGSKMSFGRKSTWDKQILLDISSVCPHKCVYCAHQNLGLHTPELMDDKIFYKIVDILKHDGVTGIFPYMSGEPFCHPHIHEFLKYISQAGISINMATKAGVPIDPKALENTVTDFARRGKKLVFEITMPSLKEEDMVKEFVTCNPKVIKANIDMMMDLAKRSKGLELIFITVVTDANSQNLKENKEFFNSRGFRWVRKKAGYWLNVKPVGVSQVRHTLDRCAFTTHPAISPKGNVTICCHDFLFQMNLGNVIEQGSITKIINSAEYQKTLEAGNNYSLPLCKGCV